VCIGLFAVSMKCSIYISSGLTHCRATIDI
jgi:hypothetical protein